MFIEAVNPRHGASDGRSGAAEGDGNFHDAMLAFLPGDE